MVSKRGAAKLKQGAYREQDAEEGDDAMLAEDSSEQEEDTEWDTACHYCSQSDDYDAMLGCAGKTPRFSCSKVCHAKCAGVEPDDVWYCESCDAIKDLEEVEKFLGVRYQAADSASKAEGSGASSKERPREFHIKRLNMSYLHCIWVTEEQVLEACKHWPGLKSKYRNFLGKLEDAGGVEALELADEELGLEYGVNPLWLQPDRVIAEETDEDGDVTRLFKWKGLDYEDCTWEEEDDIGQYDLEPFVEQFQALQAIEDQAADARKRSEGAAKGGADDADALAKTKRDARTYTDTPTFLEGGVLHPYQLDGLNWLLMGFSRNQNMVLADEMGLGKTVQSIALLACLREKGVDKPHLVVVPLSTLPNWEREFAKWAPQLYVVSLKGNLVSRKTIKKYESTVELAPASHSKSKPQASRQSVKQSKRGLGTRFHVLLTTYESVLQEATWVSSYEWSTLTVDEGHRLKNSKSKLYQVLAELDIDCRLLLTGTPLQNNLDELFMLMQFIEPEKFNSLEHFLASFSNITQQEQVEKLHELLREHILRRLKKDVLKQLPPKREQIVRVELSEQQRNYYKQILVKQFPALAARGGASSSVTAGVLKNVVMELRKCCNHPYLFEELPEAALEDASLETLVAASGKLHLLDRMMQVFKKKGHRVLIYSQFTRTLDILEHWLLRRGWGHQRVDGSVRGNERQARIDRFNNDLVNNFVFLLSTRAGGVGINLATADTIVIFDSDWNPHNDIQAQARAHRLGQSKAVFTYRFVTRGTVEERMMQRAKQKRMLESVVMGRTDLKQSDLDDILRYGAQELFADDEDFDAVKEDKAGENQGGSGAGSKNGAEGQDAAQGADEAGDTGHGTESPKRKRDRRIHYDDAALDMLLDRESRLAQAEDEKDDDFMSAFKVADFELSEAEAAALEEKSRPELSSSKFWDTLLKDKHEAMTEQELAAMGRGRRTRRTVNYNEDAIEEEHGGRARKRKLAAREDAHDVGAGDSEWQPEVTTQICEGDPRGPEFKIYGMKGAQRAEVIDALLRYGLPLNEEHGFDSDYIARRLQTDPRFERVPRSDLEAYVKLVLNALYRCTSSSSSSAPLTLPNGTAVPREVFFFKHPLPLIVERLGVLHLVRVKLRKFDELTERGPAQVGLQDVTNGSVATGAAGPAAAQNLQAQRTRFLVNGGTNRNTKWWNIIGPRVASRTAPHPEAWTEAHDRNLLKAAATHGCASAWAAVADDPQYALGAAMRRVLALNEPSPVPTKPPESTPETNGQAQKEPGTTRDSPSTTAAPAAQSGDPTPAVAATPPLTIASTAISAPVDAGKAAAERDQAGASAKGAEQTPLTSLATPAADAVAGTSAKAEGSAAATAAGAAAAEPATTAHASADAPATRDTSAAATAAAAPAATDAAAPTTAGGRGDGGATGPSESASDSAARTGPGSGAPGSASTAAQPLVASTAKASKWQPSRAQDPVCKMLQERFSFLVGEISEESMEWSGPSVQYVGKMTFEQPLSPVSLTRADVELLERCKRSLERALLAISEHTNNASQQSHPNNPQAASDAALQFRVLVHDYHSRLREHHEVAIRLLFKASYHGTLPVPQDCKPRPIASVFAQPESRVAIALSQHRVRENTRQLIQGQAVNPIWGHNQGPPVAVHYQPPQVLHHALMQQRTAMRDLPKPAVQASAPREQSNAVATASVAPHAVAANAHGPVAQGVVRATLANNTATPPPTSQSRTNERSLQPVEKQNGAKQVTARQQQQQQAPAPQVLRPTPNGAEVIDLSLE